MRNLRQPMQVTHSRAALDAAEARLRDIEPTGRLRLRDSSSVVRVLPKGSYYLAHVAASQRCLHLRVVPKRSGYGWCSKEHITSLATADSAEKITVVGCQPGVTLTARTSQRRCI